MSSALKTSWTLVAGSRDLKCFIDAGSPWCVFRRWSTSCAPFMLLMPQGKDGRLACIGAARNRLVSLCSRHRTHLTTEDRNSCRRVMVNAVAKAPLCCLHLRRLDSHEPPPQRIVSRQVLLCFAHRFAPRSFFCYHELETDSNHKQRICTQACAMSSTCRWAKVFATLGVLRLSGRTGDWTLMGPPRHATELLLLKSTTGHVPRCIHPLEPTAQCWGHIVSSPCRATASFSTCLTPRGLSGWLTPSDETPTIPGESLPQALRG